MKKVVFEGNMPSDEKEDKDPRYGEFHNRDCKRIGNAILTAIREHPTNMGRAFEHAAIATRYSPSTLQNYYYKKDELVIGMSLKQYAEVSEIGFVLVDSVTGKRLAPINVKTIRKSNLPALVIPKKRSGVTFQKRINIARKKKK